MGRNPPETRANSDEINEAAIPLDVKLQVLQNFNNTAADEPMYMYVHLLCLSIYPIDVYMCIFVGQGIYILLRVMVRHSGWSRRFKCTPIEKVQSFINTTYSLILTLFAFHTREKGRDLNQYYSNSPYTNRQIQKVMWQHRNATKNFYYMYM